MPSRTFRRRGVICENEGLRGCWGVRMEVNMLKHDKIEVIED